MRERVLVTGGFGFLGGHLLEQLLANRNVQIHVVDDLSSNPIEVEVLLEELGRPRNLTYERRSVSEFMRDGPERFDSIVHLASLVGAAGVLPHGGRLVSSIIEDTYLLADYAIEHGARLLDVSTGEVHGGGRDGLCSEDDAKIVPAHTSARLEYAVAKLAAETALINLHARVGLNVVIVRPFNIAGPRQSGEGGFVLPRFLAQARLGLPLTIFGTGTARRAFSHVGDMADGLIRALRWGNPGTAYNLGNRANRVTVEELADLVIEVTGSATRKQFVDPTEIYGSAFAESNDKFAAEGRAATELGWSPRRGVETIVRDAWEYLIEASPNTFSRLAGSKVIDQLAKSEGRRAAALAY